MKPPVYPKLLFKSPEVNIPSFSSLADTTTRFSNGLIKPEVRKRNFFKQSPNNVFNQSYSQQNSYYCFSPLMVFPYLPQNMPSFNGLNFK